jgi:hypothetical protein
MKCNHCGKDIPQRLILADAARILAKKGQASETMNPWERACREWLKGCSCAEDGRQEECKECTAAFLNHIKHLAQEGGCK